MEYSIDENLKYLDNGLFYLGFGKEHSDEVSTHLNNGAEQFSVNHADKFHGKEIDYRIDHKRSAESGWISISGFLLTPREKPEAQQYFGVFKNKGFTAKEAFNLVEGRAVCKDHWKDSEKYESWHVMNFEKKTAKGNAKIDNYHENFGFDVAKALQNLNWSKVTGQGMPPWAEENLRKGDPLRGTLEIEGMDVEANIIANPKSREVLGVDDEGKIIARAEGLSEAYQQKKGVQQDNDLITNPEVSQPAHQVDEQHSEAATMQETPPSPGPDDKQVEEQTAALAAEYFNNNTEGEAIDPFLEELARDLNADVSELNDIPFMPDDPTVMDQQAGKDIDAAGTIAESGKQVNEPGQELAGKEVAEKGPELTGDTTKVDAKKPADDKKKVTTDKTSGKSKEKVERIPPRQHAPLDDMGPSKGKKR